jgi:hypothetical protein
MVEDINFSIRNNTKKTLNIVVFQQDKEIKGMFETIFPVAWRVMTLPGNTTDSKDGLCIWNFTYPVPTYLGVSEIMLNMKKKRPLLKSKTGTGINLKMTMNIMELLAGENERLTLVEAADGQSWEFSINTDDKPALTLMTGPNPDAAISCSNKADKKVNISLYKDFLPLISAFDVGKNSSAEFYLTTKLWVMHSGDVQQGDKIVTFVDNSKSQEIDLKYISRVILTLNEDPSTGEITWELKTG